MPKKIIINSLKQSFSSIWRNKSLFILLFILQIVFFFAFAQINLTFQTRILKSAQAIEDYISQQKLDEPSVSSNIFQQKSILGDDPLSISRNFNEIMRNFRIYLAYLFILLVSFTSIAWALTYKLAYKIKLKQLAKDFLKISAVLLPNLSLIFIFLFLLFNISLANAENIKIFNRYIPLLIFSAVLTYFMFISLSLLRNTELKNIVQKTLSIGIKKAHYIFLIYLINIFLLILPIILLFYFIEKNFLILLLSLILMMFSFVFGRIFMVNAVEKLS